MFILSTLSLSLDQNGARIWLGTACEHWTLSPYEINWYLFLYINNKMWMHFKCSVNALFVVVIVCALKMSPSSKCSQYTRMAPKYTTSVPIIMHFHKITETKIVIDDRRRCHPLVLSFVVITFCLAHKKWNEWRKKTWKIDYKNRYICRGNKMSRVLIATHLYHPFMDTPCDYLYECNVCTHQVRYFFASFLWNGTKRV